MDPAFQRAAIARFLMSFQRLLHHSVHSTTKTQPRDATAATWSHQKLQLHCTTQWNARQSRVENWYKLNCQRTIPGGMGCRLAKIRKRTYEHSWRQIRLHMHALRHSSFSLFPSHPTQEDKELATALHTSIAVRNLISLLPKSARTLQNFQLGRQPPCSALLAPHSGHPLAEGIAQPPCTFVTIKRLQVVHQESRWPSWELIT